MDNKNNFEIITKNINMRYLHINDYNKGFLELFYQLNNVKINMTYYEFVTKVLDINNQKSHIIVIECNDKIIGTGKIIIEEKFYDNLGHIEDIIVDENYRGKGIGKQIIDELVKIGKTHRCYKVILNSLDKNKTFYSKCDFTLKGFEFCKYI